MQFTDKYIKSLTPRQNKYVVSNDSETRGTGRLQIVVYPSGTKKFQFQYYWANAKKRMEMGTYPIMTLFDANKEFIRLSELLQTGIDPKNERDQEKEVIQKKAGQKTLKELYNNYILHIETILQPVTVRRVRDTLRSNLIPFISETLLPADYTPNMAREHIYALHNRGALSQAAKFRSNLMMLFKFAIDFDNSPEQFLKPDIYGVEVNPMRDVSYQAEKKVGNRFLSEEELKKVWFTTTLPTPVQLYVKLQLALAGQRVRELYNANISEFDLKHDVFTIPVERVKIKRRGVHLVPLSDLAKSILKELALLRGSAGHIWPHRYINSQHGDYTRLNKNITQWCIDEKALHFAPKDLRRTCKTHMGKAGIDKLGKDLLQQHSRSDVSSVNYDRYDYYKEKQAAMAVWTEYLKKTLSLD